MKFINWERKGIFKRYCKSVGPVFLVVIHTMSNFFPKTSF